MSVALLSRARFIKASGPRLVGQARTPVATRKQSAVAMAGGNGVGSEEVNVLGGKLELCCTDPMTGFHRDGFCRVSAADGGVHAVCAQVTEEFLEFSASRGNDLSSVVKPGQKWCLCVSRWKEAKVAGKAPPVILASTSRDALQSLTIEELQEHALDVEKTQ